MKLYDDNTNKTGMRVLFIFGQMFVLFIVYGIVYMAFLAVGLAVSERGTSKLMYIPVLLAMGIYPFLLYRYRKMFNAGRMLGASIWTLSSASVIIVLLYLYSDKITA